jgi:hypothetical protein
MLFQAKLLTMSLQQHSEAEADNYPGSRKLTMRAGRPAAFQRYQFFALAR